MLFQYKDQNTQTHTFWSVNYNNSDQYPFNAELCDTKRKVLLHKVRSTQTNT